LRESGLADLLGSLRETVWVGLSAESMVMTLGVGEDSIRWRPPTGDETTLGVVDFSICPHLAADGMPGNSMAEAEQWAAGISNKAYAMDDQTAITVVDGDVDFVSEGRWKQLRTLTSEPDQGRRGGWPQRRPRSAPRSRAVEIASSSRASQP
jgi:dipeptidase E